jgi:hypothetical protein
VQQDSYFGRCFFFRGNSYPFTFKLMQGAAHKVIGAQGMMQTGMHSAGINEMRKGHLVNSPQTLVIRMRNNRKNERIINCDKAVNGVVDDLSDAIRHSLPSILLKLLPKAADKSTKAGRIN